MMENYDPHPDYAALPEAIKAVVTPKQFAWLTDDERSRLEQELTEPEIEDV